MWILFEKSRLLVILKPIFAERLFFLLNNGQKYPKDQFNIHFEVDPSVCSDSIPDI